jgi:hypothetical protein
MALVVSITIVGLVIIGVPLVALMVIVIFMTTMLTVAQFMATRDRKLAHFPFIWLLLVLGNFLKNASRLVSRLTLLKENDHLEWIGRHRLVQVCKPVLVCLRLHKEDLFTLLCAVGTSIVQQK